MAHSDTYIDSSLPFGLARVAAVTGNPMLDIGYQCRDSRPYFAFIGGYLLNPETYYTTLAPSKATSATTVDVYQLGSKVVDGVTYDAMELVGTGTQTGTVLDYVTLTYINTNNAHVDIREFNINKWAKYKPQVYNKLGPLTDTERKNETWPYGMQVVSSGGYFPALHERFYAYAGLPGDGDIARLTDFAGYNHEAAPDLSAEITLDGSTVTVDFKSNPTEGSLTFAELITYNLGESSLDSFYPYLLASMAEEDGETYNTHYACALKLNGSDSPFETLDARTADLSEIPAYVSGRKWKLTVFFRAALMYNGVWADVSSALALECHSLPGATGIEVAYLTLSTDTLDFGTSASLLSFVIDSSSAWKMGNSLLYGFTLSQTSGEAGQTTVTVACSVSSSTGGSATITFTNDDDEEATLTITYGARNYIAASSNTVNLGSGSGSGVGITITSTSAWTVSGGSDDVRVNPSSGSSGTTEVTVSRLTVGTSGSAVYTFTNDEGASATVTVNYTAN